MAYSTYNEAIGLVLKEEGGYTNHPDDPGGPTNWGITIFDARKYWKKNATALDVKDMPLQVAKDIYKSKYWDAQRCSELPAGVDYVIMDYGVNSGIGRSGKVLRRALGLSDKTSVVTDEVIAACLKADRVKIINYVMSERLAFLRSLKIFSTFGRGWTARCARVKAVALRMANAPTLSLVVGVPEPTAKGVVALNKKAQGGTASAVLIGGTTTATTQSHNPWAVAAIIGVTAIVVGAIIWYFVWKQKRDQEAPVNVAMAT